MFFFFFQAEDGIRDGRVTGVQTCALPIWRQLVRPTGIAAGIGDHARAVRGHRVTAVAAGPAEELFRHAARRNAVDRADARVAVVVDRSLDGRLRDHDLLAHGTDRPARALNRQLDGVRVG